MIFKMGFAAYFLLVADIVSHVRFEMGIRCACRGSAAGSLVCYLLGISDVDPVRYDLLFLFAGLAMFTGGRRSRR